MTDTSYTPTHATLRAALHAKLKAAVTALGFDPEYFQEEFKLADVATHLAISDDELRAVLLEAAGAEYGDSALPPLLGAETIGQAVDALLPDAKLATPTGAVQTPPAENQEPPAPPADPAVPSEPSHPQTTDATAGEAQGAER